MNLQRYAFFVGMLLCIYTPATHSQQNQAAPVDSKPKAAPSFEASGLQSNIAPSGYSTGATEEQSHQVATLVAQLQTESIPTILPKSAIYSCNRQAELLHDALAQPTSFEANHNVGLFYLQHGDPKLSGRYLQTAADARPGEHDNLVELAVASLEVQDYTKASEIADHLLQSNSADPAAHEIRGAVGVGMGRSGSALAEYKRTVELDPSATNISAAGVAMLSLGSFPEAEATLLLGIRLHPSSADLWTARGLAEILSNTKPQAIVSLLQATTLDRSGVLPPTLLAVQAGGAPSTDAKILKRLKKLTEDDPGNAVIHYDYALALFKVNEGKQEEVLLHQIESELKLALAEQPTFAAAHYQLGVIYSDYGRNSLAIPELARANQLEPEVAEWHYRLARAYRQEKKTAAADDQMQKFQRLKARRNAGEDVSTDLLARLALQSVQQAFMNCQSALPISGRY